MTSIDPAVEERFAQILASTRAKSADIGDRLEAANRQIAEESQRMRDANERLCQELDEQSAAKAAAKEDPAAKNEWLRRNAAEDSTYQFADAEDAPETTEHTPPPAREGRHARRDDVEDDFSNRNWLG